MKPIDSLWPLFLHFFLLSFFAIGGVSTTLPEMHRYLVEQQHWMTNDQFTALYALSQAAPGPNVIFVGLFGWQVAGITGGLISLFAICGPASLIALCFEIFSFRSNPGGWADVARKGLAPVGVGMMCATGYVLAQGLHPHVTGIALTVIAVLVELKTKIHPLWLIGLGAFCGAVGLV